MAGKRVGILKVVARPRFLCPPLIHTNIPQTIFTNYDFYHGLINLSGVILEK